MDDLWTDDALVRRVREGDRRAYGDLVSRYAMVVRGLCAGVVGLDAAEEVAHASFVEAWLKLRSLRDPARFAPWLRTLTLNLCRQWLRRRQRARTSAGEVEPDQLPAAGPAEEAALDSLCRGLAQLSRLHRLTLALHYDLGLKYHQIAAFLDVPVGTVMSRLSRARSNLQNWMEEMSQTDAETDGPGTDSFRESVEAEIEVLLQLWDEESPDARGRFFSQAGKRLSVLVESAPDTMRELLGAMGEALTEHAALLLRRAGRGAVAVAVACAFGENPVSRANARRVLRRVLGTDADQPLNDPYFVLPLRLTATHVLDPVIRCQQSDGHKAALLVELLPGCEDDATHVLMAHVLRAYGVHSLPLLMAAWQSAGDDRASRTYAAALVRLGTPAYAALAERLEATDPAALRRTLEALQTAVGQSGGFCLSRGPSPDPALEWRVSGRRPREDLDAGVAAGLCTRLEGLTRHADAAVRDRAVAVLGEMGDTEHAPAVRGCLRSAAASTRHAAAVALSGLEDRGSIPDLMRLAREDDPSGRRAALQALGHLRAAEARDLLVELVGDQAVRPHAVSALGELDDDESKAVLRGLTGNPDKKVARMAANALYGGARTDRPASELRRERLARIRGRDAQPLMHTSMVAAIRHLPEARAYPEKELTRLIGEVCGDYSTTRRELVMGKPGLMVRRAGVYELSDDGLAVWRVERFLKDHAASPVAGSALPRPWPEDLTAAASGTAS